MKNLILSATVLLTSVSVFAAPPADLHCEAQLSKRTRLVMEKAMDQSMNVKIYKSSIFGTEKLIADVTETVQFKQNLNSKGPYVGYENNAYGDSFVNPALREDATLYYNSKIQIKVPYTAEGAKMEDARDSVLTMPEVLDGPTKVQCKVLIFG